jgi:hypothetical protein
LAAAWSAICFLAVLVAVVLPTTTIMNAAATKSASAVSPVRNIEDNLSGGGRVPFASSAA